ncbi:hypothetical protein [Crateriforma conspicua]|uniref:Uncharacterized protein n=1 Tax=Crateriforma conspicua TaxID=2527996 RepID=A0A5C5Y6G7_9PLAN|nr:hypothetical protein [Crateriforma conspicua]QDV65886.1 hypothetical protein Mal65_50590 [Crateriforma conspicua]TWT71286.1 hypothetical protein Pan14r_35960 [Crateriforma conspicua]
MSFRSPICSPFSHFRITATGALLLASVTLLACGGGLASAGNPGGLGHAGKHHLHHDSADRYAAKKYVVGYRHVGCGYRPWGGYAYGVSSPYRSGLINSYANVLHGRADVIRSLGVANLNHAHAQTQWEVARSAAMQNGIDALVARQERQQINRESRFGRVYDRATARKAAAAMVPQIPGGWELPEGLELTGHWGDAPIEPTADANGIETKAMGLSSQYLDPISGRLNWPALLQHDHFAKARRPLDELFARRAVEGWIEDRHLPSLRDWVAKIDQEVDRLDVPEPIRSEAHRFLAGLVDEAHTPNQPINDPAGMLERIADNR